MYKLISFAFSAAFFSCTPARSEIENVYLKNNGMAPGEIWINNEYQGYVPGGQACYATRLGFVTSGSGRINPDGSRATVQESHGGWSTHRDLTVRICQVKGGTPYKSSVILKNYLEADLGGSNKKSIVWFGENSAGQQPSESELSAEIRPIYSAKEGDDCGPTTKSGVAATNQATKQVAIYSGHFSNSMNLGQITLKVFANGNFAIYGSGLGIGSPSCYGTWTQASNQDTNFETRKDGLRFFNDFTGRAEAGHMILKLRDGTVETLTENNSEAE